MSFAVRYYASARKELNECLSDYGEEFRHDVEAWLQELAERASKDDLSFALDADNCLENGAEYLKRWKDAYQIWRDADIATKLSSLLYALRKGKPPWIMKMTVRWFTVLGVFPSEVHAYFRIDQIKQEIVFIAFDGLPGQT